MAGFGLDKIDNILPVFDITSSHLKSLLVNVSLVAFHQFRMVLSPYIKVKFLGDPFLKTLSI